MTSKERFSRMYQHKEADRIPITDDLWQGTLRRFHNEGMPTNVDWEDYFGIDKTAGISIDISPRYPNKVIEETSEYTIYTTNWGVTQKSFKLEDSTPQFLDFTVTNPKSWEEAKARMTLTDDRIDWQYLKENYPKWVSEGRFISGNFWFGFDVTHSWMMGTENMLVAMYEEPDMVKDMFDTYLDRSIALFERVWDAGYHFHHMRWWDDMGYKNSLFFSNEMYRELLKPTHKRAVDWAHNHGIYAHLHSCGDIMDRIQDLVEIGVDALNPIEIKAGMKPFELKEKYGDRLVLHGGINAALWHKKEEVLAEIERLVPTLKENSGYIFSSDHSIPSSVTLENAKAIFEAAKKYGKYS